MEGDDKMRRDEEMKAEESQGGLWGTDVKISEERG